MLYAKTYYLRIKGLSENEVKKAYTMSDHVVGIIEDERLVGFEVAETAENIISIIGEFNASTR